MSQEAHWIILVLDFTKLTHFVFLFVIYFCRLKVKNNLSKSITKLIVKVIIDWFKSWLSNIEKCLANHLHNNEWPRNNNRNRLCSKIRLKGRLFLHIHSSMILLDAGWRGRGRLFPLIGHTSNHSPLFGNRKTHSNLQWNYKSIDLDYLLIKAEDRFTQLTLRLPEKKILHAQQRNFGYSEHGWMQNAQGRSIWRHFGEAYV